MMRRALLMTIVASGHLSIFAQPPPDPLAAQVQRLTAGDPVDRSRAAKCSGQWVHRPSRRCPR